VLTYSKIQNERNSQNFKHKFNEALLILYRSFDAQKIWQYRPALSFTLLQIQSKKKNKETLK